MSARRGFLEEDEWKVRKIINRINTTKRSPHLYKFNRKPLNTPSSYKLNSTEVVVKITSNSRNLKSINDHIDYISRNGKVELLTSDELAYSGKEEIKEAKNIFRDEGSTIPEKAVIGKRQYRETYNMVFSLKDVSGENLKKAAYKTLKEKCPDNYFVIAFHGDTDHSHCHICLKSKSSINGKRIDMRKKDLNEIRKNFARNLRDLGIIATATIREKKEQEIAKEEKEQQHFYEIIGFGKAPYEHIEGNKITGYVKYLTSKGEECILYGDDIERAVKESGVKIGEKARLRIIDKQPVTITVKEKDRKTGEWKTYEKNTFKNIWECITLEMAKKQKESKIEDKRQVLKDKIVPDKTTAKIDEKSMKADKGNKQKEMLK